MRPIKAGRHIYGPRYLKLLLLTSSSFVVLGLTGLASAARPLPPCSPPAFAGSVAARASRSVHKPPLCRVGLRGRGLQGITGKTGTPGRTGAAGQTGLNGAAGLRGPSGNTGGAGAAGPDGPAGPAGVTGSQGPQGVQGVTGATGSGATGAQGATGPAGPAGATGPNGPAGSTGAQGTSGAVGATGPVGSTGPTGATGSAATKGLSQYAYVYNDAGQTVEVDTDITFSKSGRMTAGITHADGDAAIALVNAGDYKVTFSVSGTETNQMALFVNATPLVPGNATLVAGTVYGSAAGAQQNTGQAIVTAAAGSVLTIRNHTTTAAVTLATPLGGNQVTTNASVVIEKLD
jgi:Collagen triple helix repeat (20 copies)